MNIANCFSIEFLVPKAGFEPVRDITYQYKKYFGMKMV
jgi:hypothetical protein